MRGRRRLIHLNGVPGIGKSTLAARYAAEHPGTMAVELDALRTWVGGWREADPDLLLAVRSAGLALCSAWLGSGRDVVLPQLVARTDHIEWFRDIATRSGAELVELVLIGDRDHLVAAELLAYHDALVAGGASWPAAITIPSRVGEADETYAAVLSALS